MLAHEAEDRSPVSGRGRMSILFTTNTIFLPHSRICSRKPRSLSVNGRSAQVTKRTRSARGMKSRVSASCRRIIALVPGRVHDGDLAEQLGKRGAFRPERRTRGSVIAGP